MTERRAIGVDSYGQLVLSEDRASLLTAPRTVSTGPMPGAGARSGRRAGVDSYGQLVLSEDRESLLAAARTSPTGPVPGAGAPSGRRARVAAQWAPQIIAAIAGVAAVAWSLLTVVGLLR